MYALELSASDERGRARLVPEPTVVVRDERMLVRRGGLPLVWTGLSILGVILLGYARYLHRGLLSILFAGGALLYYLFHLESREDGCGELCHARFHGGIEAFGMCLFLVLAWIMLKHQETFR